MSQPTHFPTQLPENLRVKFQALERRLWWVDTTIAVCGALSGLVIGLVASAGPAIDLLVRPLASAVKPAA